MSVVGSSRKNPEVLQLSPDSEVLDPKGFASIDVVVHCAARVHQMKKESQDEELFHRDNVDFSRKIANACLESGVSHFIFLSSIKVLGEATVSVPFNAHSVPNPLDAYARSKLMAEHTLSECVRDRGMALSIVRIPLVYGLGAKGNLALLERLAARGVPLPLGGIQNRRNLLSIRNLNDFVAHLILTGGIAGYSQVFLVADESPVSTPDIYTYLGRLYHKKLYLPKLPMALLRSVGMIPLFMPIVERLTGNLEIDISQTVQSTGWRPRHAALTD